MHAGARSRSAPRRSRSSTRASPTAPSGRSTTTSSPSRSSTGSGGTPTSRSTGGSPRRPPSWPPRTAWSGCTTTSCSWSRRCCASCGPTCASASSCTSRSRPRELFVQLPWRRQILEGLLGADLVGFQRSGGAQNFVRLVRQRVGHKTHRDLVYLPDGRIVEADAFPISIDYAGPRRAVASPTPWSSRAKEIREQLGNPRARAARRRPARLHQGHLHAAQGLRRAPRRGRAVDVEDAVFVQVATPSRERVDEYRRLRDEIDRLVGRINGDYGRIGRPAISYLHSSYPRDEMAAMFRAADIMVVTPLRDGMNLVAKEYVACRDRRGRRAGALGVRRGGRRAQAGVPGEPLRHQRDEGDDPRRPCREAAEDLHRRMRAMRKTVADARRRRLGRRVRRSARARSAPRTARRVRQPTGRDEPEAEATRG